MKWIDLEMPRTSLEQAKRDIVYRLLNREMNKQETQYLIEQIAKKYRPVPMPPIDSNIIELICEEDLSPEQVKAVLDRAYNTIYPIWYIKKCILQLLNRGLVALVKKSIYKDGTIVKFYTAEEQGVREVIDNVSTAFEWLFKETV